MPPPARTNESFGANLSTTSISSPMRRIPSFIDDEDEEEEIVVSAAASFDAIISKSPIRGTGTSSAQSSPGTGFNKRKRNHPNEIHENELGQLNRFQEEQSQSKKNCLFLIFNFSREENDESRFPGKSFKEKISQKSK